MNVSATVASRVRHHRKQHDWTQEELATAVQSAGGRMQRATVAQIESGRRRTVTVDELVQFAEALGVAASELLTPLAPSDEVPARQQPPSKPGRRTFEPERVSPVWRF